MASQTTTPKYGPETTGLELVHQFPDEVKGRIFLITGPSHGGIGGETATSIAAGQPAVLILLGRSKARAQPVLDAIASASPSTLIKFIEVDLSLLSSVRAAAATILSDPEIPHIDVVINNAAIMASPFQRTAEGFEMQFASGHLGHFVLTNSLMPKILAGTAPVRIVNVSSVGNRICTVRWADPNWTEEGAYDPWDAYGQTKTANVLFTVALNKRLAAKGYPADKIKAYALHPGSIATNLQVHVVQAGAESMAAAIEKTFHGEPNPIPGVKTLQQGCATTLRAALDPGLTEQEGVWLVDAEISTDPTWIESWSLDEGDAERLWKLSEELVGERFEL
ncbi:NAD(P)-binding protein [Coniochaeta ligniaria NRRL 30616]|uniref:NAD(P)-binding protein n=1 Tax=Coniochaeta ligniaria NRRL 30616 TaxID=1408157 RepID=A0A1J7JFD0_9PEZI|nr:NAD(P)-binding protein [Coniochaeta ligniaria NRRL 30616]